MRDSIKEIVRKIKHLYMHIPFEVLYAIIIVLVGLSAFGLGYIDALQMQKQSITVTQDKSMLRYPKMQIQGKVVASKRGKKYHYPWCPGALKMSEKNKRWFKSEQAARNAGYTPARNCKGLR